MLLGNHCPEPLPRSTAQIYRPEPLTGGGQQRQSHHSSDRHSRELGSCGAAERGAEELGS
jgi:hypothetical protein